MLQKHTVVVTETVEYRVTVVAETPSRAEAAADEAVAEDPDKHFHAVIERVACVEE